jgi:type IV secretory pathway VirB6-like protein
MRMRRTPLLALGLSIAGALASSAALAADPTSNSSSVESLGLVPKMIDSIFGSNLMEAFVSTALGMSAALIGGANVLAGTIAMSALLWNLLKAQVERKAALPVVTEAVILAALTAGLLASYSTVVGNIIDFGRWVQGQVGGSFGSATSSLFGSMFAALVNVFKQEWATVQQTKFWNLIWGGAASALIDLIVTIFFLLVAAVLMISALVEVIGVFLIGPVVVGLGVVFGPLMIATVVSSYTRDWFWHWLRFLINGALLYAIAIATMKLFSSMIGTLVSVSNGETLLMGKAIALAMLSAGMGKIFAGIPAMADGLFPGRTGAGSGMTSGGQAAAAVGAAAAGVGAGAAMVAGAASAGTAVGASVAGAGRTAQAAKAASSLALTAYRGLRKAARQ